MRSHFGLVWIWWGLLVPIAALAQEDVVDKTLLTDTPPSDEAIHEELRAMRKALTAAVLKGDADAQLEYIHDNVVVTWQNNQVVRGSDGLKKFLAGMNSGGERVFKGYKEEPTADELTILYGGDTGIVFGKSVPHYKYLGMEFDLENRWTATLVKDGDKWKIAAYHVSGNLIDNPVLSAAKQAAYWAAGIGAVVGMCVGGILVKVLQKRRA